MFEGDAKTLEKVVNYMKSHWPSKVKDEWQVDLAEYPAIAEKVFQDFTAGKTRKKHFVRIAGLSGSGKTTQLLPATEAYFEVRELKPVLVAARRFVEYHPHYQEILDFYGEENVRKLTDEFSTIMMFMILGLTIRAGYDIILDVTLLDPSMERILADLLTGAKYQTLLLMIAASPEVTEKHLGGRSWRHTRETELEFIRATRLALDFYAREMGEMRVVLWNVYDSAPIYDGAAKNAVPEFTKYSEISEIPEHDEDVLREAKVRYLKETNDGVEE